MSDGYEIGYGKPPKQTRFRKGQSGNPKGRPRGTKNLITDLSEELREQLYVTENGKRRRVSKQRAMLKSITAKAIGGDIQATNTILRVLERALADDQNPNTGQSLLAEDQQIIDLFMEKPMQRGSNNDD